MKRSVAPVVVCLLAAVVSPWPNASSAVIGTSGSVTLTAAPYPAPSDETIFVFDELQSVPFVGTQSLNFGDIAPGTLVNSHYLQFDTASPTAFVGPGSVTFDGPLLGLATSTGNLTANLAPDAPGTSDDHFGLALSLGPYPSGADPAFRGLGSAEDDLIIDLGSHTLLIDSLEIGLANQVDGVRVFTAIPEPGGLLLLLAGAGSFTSRRPAVHR
ncbi:MAG: hypothetical protein CMJ18_04290 [Phycisphaeraceae bacterium]|nr:hypothetical protein [Phycisphaeraceae bacterium]